MSPVTETKDSKASWEAPLALPLNESIWLAWKRKGRLHDQQTRARGLITTKMISGATLLLAAVLWSQVAPYEILIRFIVVLGAIVMTFRAVETRQYAAAIVFGVLGLLYNPLVPIFSFSGDLQRALVAASAIPFVASLFWGKETLAS